MLPTSSICVGKLQVERKQAMITAAKYYDKL